MSKKLAEEYKKKMLEVAEIGDEEIAHSKADSLLVELLTKLGYAEVTKAWNKVGKWYA